MNQAGFEFVKQFSCDCGRIHNTQVDDVIVERGAVNRVAEVIARYDAKTPFILADENTYETAGKKVCSVLKENGIAYTKFVYQGASPEPDEFAVGSCMMHYNPSCDIIVAVGSGVINDIGKIVANVTNNPYIIVGTVPPWMDKPRVHLLWRWMV